VAEPNDDMWVLVRLVLVEEGHYELERTRTYPDTLAALERGNPDVILVEPRMTGGDPTELLDRIASEAKRRGKELVLMSEWDHAPMIAERHGLILLRRPFSLDEFLDAVRRAAERCSLEIGRPSPLPHE